MLHQILRSARVSGIALAVALAAGTAGAQTNPAPEPAATAGEVSVPETNVTSFTLDNGLQVVVLPDRRAPVVTQMIYYKVGSADEAPGESGIAHFLEHLMFKGTSNYPEGEFSREVAAIGGQENAFTTDDYTGYYQQVPADALEMIMRYEADRMSNLVLTDEVVLPERDVIQEERRMRVGNEPGAKLSEIIQAALFINSPYGSPVIGWPEEIAALTREDAIAFYDKYYTPKNAILFIAGDVDTAEVKRLAEKYYGTIAQRAEIGARARPQTPEPVAERSVTLRDARVTQPSLQINYLVPSATSGLEGEAPALDLLSDILGGGTTSRLYRDLIVEKGIAAEAAAYYSGDAVDDTRFVLYGTPRGAANLDEVEAAMRAEIARVVKDGITEEDLERSKNRVRKSVIYLRDSQTAMARRYAEALATGRTIADVESWPERIEAVTVEDVNRVARQYLTPERSVTGYLLPAEAETAAAEAPAPNPQAMPDDAATTAPETRS